MDIKNPNLLLSQIPNSEIEKHTSHTHKSTKRSEKLWTGGRTGIHVLSYPHLIKKSGINLMEFNWISTFSKEQKQKSMIEDERERKENLWGKAKEIVNAKEEKEGKRRETDEKKVCWVGSRNTGFIM